MYSACWDNTQCFELGSSSGVSQAKKNETNKKKEFDSFFLAGLTPDEEPSSKCCVIKLHHALYISQTLNYSYDLYFHSAMQLHKLICKGTFTAVCLQNDQATQFETLISPVEGFVNVFHRRLWI